MVPISIRSGFGQFGPLPEIGKLTPRGFFLRNGKLPSHLLPLISSPYNILLNSDHNVVILYRLMQDYEHTTDLKLMNLFGIVTFFVICNPGTCRKIQSIAFVSDYNNNEYTRLHIRICAAFAYLPISALQWQILMTADYAFKKCLQFLKR